MSIQDLIAYAENCRQQMIEENSTFSQVIIYQYRLRGFDAIERILSIDAPEDEILSRLETFLIENWQLIQDSLLCYTALPDFPLHRLCYAIARKLQEFSPKPHVLQYLIPGIYFESYYSDYKDLSDDIEHVMKTHILSENGKFLFPVYLLTEINIMNGPYSRLMNPFYDLFDKDLVEADALLNKKEIHQLYQHSGLTQEIFDNIQQYEYRANQEENLYTQLHQLQRALYLNSVHALGKEMHAGEGVYRAIEHFHEFYTHLTPAQIETIPKGVLAEIDKLFTLTSPTAQRRDGAIDTCGDTRRTDLMAAMSNHDEILSSVTIADATRESLISLHINRYHSLRQELKKASYWGNDKKLVTNKVLVALNIPIEVTEDNIQEIFKNLDVVSLDYYFSQPNFMNSVIRILHNIQEYVIVLIHLDPEKIEPILKHLRPYLTGLLNYSKDLFVLLMGLSDEKIEIVSRCLMERFATILFSENSTAGMYNRLVSWISTFQSIEQCLAIFRGLTPLLLEKLTSFSEFKSMMDYFRPSIAGQLIEPLKQLWKLEIQSSSDLGWISALWSLEQARNNYRRYEKLFHELIKTPQDVNLFFNFISRKSVKNSFFKMMKTWMPKPIELCDLEVFWVNFENNPKICFEMFQICFDTIDWNRSDAYYLGKILTKLNEEHRNMVYSRLTFNPDARTCEEYKQVFKALENSIEIILEVYEKIESALLVQVRTEQDMIDVFGQIKINDVVWKNQIIEKFFDRLPQWKITVALYRVLFNLCTEKKYVETIQEYYWKSHAEQDALDLLSITEIVSIDKSFLSQSLLLSKLLDTMPVQDSNFWNFLSLWERQLPTPLVNMLHEMIIDVRYARIPLSKIVSVVLNTHKPLLITHFISHLTPELFDKRIFTIADLNDIIKDISPIQYKKLLQISKHRIMKIIVQDFVCFDKLKQNLPLLPAELERYKEFLTNSRDVAINLLQYFLSFQNWSIEQYRLLMPIHHHIWPDLLSNPSMLLFYMNNLKKTHFRHFKTCLTTLIPEMTPQLLIEISQLSYPNRFMDVFFPDFFSGQRCFDECVTLLAGLQSTLKEDIILLYSPKMISLVSHMNDFKKFLSVCGPLHFRRVLGQIPIHLCHDLNDLSILIAELPAVYESIVLDVLEFEIFNLGRQQPEETMDVRFVPIVQKHIYDFNLLKDYIPEDIVMNFIKTTLQYQNLSQVESALNQLVRGFDKEAYESQNLETNYLCFLANKLFHLQTKTYALIKDVLPQAIFFESTDILGRLRRYLHDIRGGSGVSNDIHESKRVRLV